jgi:hypothetical protein
MSLWNDYKSSPFSIPGFFKTFSEADPSKDANRYLGQIPGVGHNAYDPFINQGREAGNKLGGEYGKMLDPTAFMDEIMGHYKESQGATYEKDKLGRGIGNTAAAGGFAGTPEHQREYGEMAGNIMSKDMQQYLQNALQIHGKGVEGEQDFYNKGYGASGSLADLLGGNLASQGSMAFQQGQQHNQNRTALMSAIAKALAQYAGGGAGGGAA